MPRRRNCSNNREQIPREEAEMEVVTAVGEAVPGAMEATNPRGESGPRGEITVEAEGVRGKGAEATTGAEVKPGETLKGKVSSKRVKNCITFQAGRRKGAIYKGLSGGGMDNG